MSGRREPLGFIYGPLPKWVFAAYTRGELSEPRFVVHAYLFRFARSDLLRERGETPRLSLDTLAEAIRWRHKLASLTHLLGLMRADGELGYRITGNPTTGYRYVFRLYPDGPKASDPRPTSESVSQSQEPGWEEGASADARPTSPSSRPTSDEPSNPHQERDREPAAQPPRPTFLDVRDEDKPLAYGAKDGEASRSRARAREGNAQAETKASHDSGALDSNAQADPLDFAARAEAAIRRRAGLKLAADRETFEWPEHGLDGEAAILADLDALVIAELAERGDVPAGGGK